MCLNWTSGKTVAHSLGGCGTSNTPDSALLYIFSTFIHHTSQKAIFIAKDPNLAISELGDTRISSTATVMLKYSTSEVKHIYLAPSLLPCIRRYILRGYYKCPTINQIKGGGAI
ncbi:hypothetical protein V1477_021066 [Vespula maculifrons]|uniref:Uncharacterized protein n=1 Tax=Vespula maculifrons TaxID=7453 RepID=A0ABD2AH23_VESMC